MEQNLPGLTQRLPSLKRASVHPSGPKVYGLTKTPERLGPPGKAPPGFVTPKTSASEWPVYWGLARITGYPGPEELRAYPFVGGPPIWTYQAFADTGNERASNVDFVVWGPFRNARPVAIRVQTEFFHNFANISTQFYDLSQRDRLGNGFAVVDLYDYEFLRDTTGAAVIIKLKQAMGLIEGPNRIRSGQVQRV